MKNQKGWLDKYEDGGETNKRTWLDKYQPETAPRESTSVVNSLKILDDNTLDTLAKKQNRDTIDYKKAGLPVNTERFVENIQSAPENNFAVIDKGVDSIYYFNPERELITREPVITGQHQGSDSRALSMAQYMKKYDTDDHEAYFKYLEETGQRITPSKIFQVSGIRENTAENPDKIGDLYNTVFRPEREKFITQSRLRDYGSQQKLLTLMDENGVGQSTAIHGTDNPVREKAFREGTSRKLSNACINCTDDSEVFDLLGKGSKVAVVDNNSSFENIDMSKPFKYSPHNSTVSGFKNNVYDTLIKRNISKSDIDEDALSFIATVAEKESKIGRSIKNKIESKLPYSIAKSQGMFEINPKTFNHYLPSDYKGSTEDQIVAVYNFYKKNYNKAKQISDKTSIPVQEYLYNEYNSDEMNTKQKEVWQKSKTFNRMYQRNAKNDKNEKDKIHPINQITNFVNHNQSKPSRWLDNYSK